MVLRIAVFGSGAVLMALEILAFRIMAKTFGSALRETSAVIAVFLAAMSCGYYLGGKLGDRSPRMRTLVLPMFYAGVLILLVPFLDAGLSERIAGSSLPEGLHALLAACALFAPASLLMAMVSPISIRLLARDVEHTGNVAGSVAALSTAGSIGGTLLTGFYLIDAFGSIRLILYCLGLTMFLLSGAAGIGMLARKPAPAEGREG